MPGWRFAGAARTHAFAAGRSAGAGPRRWHDVHHAVPRERRSPAAGVRRQPCRRIARRSPRQLWQRQPATDPAQAPSDRWDPEERLRGRIAHDRVQLAARARAYRRGHGRALRSRELAAPDRQADTCGFR